MVDPESVSVSHLVIEKSSYLATDIMVPTQRVGQVLNRGIFLTAHLNELVEMEEFPESAYTGRHNERYDREPRLEGQGRDNRGNGNGGQGGGGNRRNKRYRRHRD